MGRLQVSSFRTIQEENEVEINIRISQECLCGLIILASKRALSKQNKTDCASCGMNLGVSSEDSFAFLTITFFQLMLAYDLGFQEVF